MRWNRVLLTAAPLLLILARAAAADEADTVAADEQTLKAARLATDGPALLEFFRKRTVTDADRDRIQGLIRDLGDDSFEAREKASAALTALGSAAQPFLEKAVKSSDLEVSRRAQDCLRSIVEGGGNSALPAAAARLLGVRKPAGAAEVLLAYLAATDNPGGAEEARLALAALAVPAGKPDKCLLEALTDSKQPLRRGAAAEALARAGVTEVRPTIRKLLQDPDAGVRLRVALALAEGKEKEAIPVLIDLLGQLPREQAEPAEDLLFRLAEFAQAAPPAVSLGSDEAARRKCRDAWQTWWRDNSGRVDLAKFGGAPRFLGYTLVVLLDLGVIQELDANKQVRWQAGGFDFPLDAQLLPGDRLLVAEHGGNKVTERNLKGDVLWEKQVIEPLAAQRLPNGNTFIATRGQLLEVDRKGSVVFQFAFPDGDLIMKAQKLRNGEFACITTSNLGTRQFYRLSATGKELKKFGVDVQTSGGRIDVLSNGHVLVPHLGANKVIEVDADGKPVWEVTVQQPIAAVRLPNGNTLVTSMNEKRAIEFDRAGKEIWEYRSGTRVTRAWRR